MAIICLLSAKGSPGVTTTSIGLGLSLVGNGARRRALLVEADPHGGDISAGFLRGEVNSQLGGMLGLATARGGDIATLMGQATVALSGDGSLRLLAGVPDARRAGALQIAWSRILEYSASDSEVDFVVDMGRLDPIRGCDPWLTQADLVLLVAKPNLPSVVSAHCLVAAFSDLDGAPAISKLRLVVVESSRTYPAAEVESAIGIPLLATLPFEPSEAKVLSEGVVPRRGFLRSGLMRSSAHLAAAVVAELPKAAHPRTAENDAEEQLAHQGVR